jgi:exopolysaccharide biosynthesis polyprenyl glycosylphosphotransferase
MIKGREPLLERMSVTFQVILTLFSFFFILLISGLFAEVSVKEKNDYIFFALIIGVIWFVLLEFFEMGKMARIQRYRHIIKQYAALVSVGAFVLILLNEVFRFENMNSLIILKFALLSFIVLTWQKISSRSVMKYFRKRGYNTRMILVIADDSSMPFIDQIIDTDDWGYIITGIVTDSQKVREKYVSMFPVYSEEEDFSNLITRKIVDEVFFCQQSFNTKSIEKRITQCKDVGIGFHIHNNVLSFSGLKPTVTFVNQQFVLSFVSNPGNYFSMKVKGIMDVLLTLVILILISPAMLLISVLIKLEDGGPVFFKQVRVGRHGRLFKCFKFRTMVVNAEELREKLMALNEVDGPVFKIKNDPRITKIGRFLRKTSLDELPQFFNVLFGDMSIVGPRPPIPSEVEQYERNLMRRLSINPGITCIWQVSGRNNISFDKWMEMDMEYIDNWSLTLDLKIILKTIKVVVRGDGQ